jgi:hypothetical protein
MNRWFFLLALGMATGAHAQSQTANYIGAERCKSCHEFEFAIWSTGPHARAHVSLTSEQLGDPKCNNCHTTSADQSTTPLIGVQCERCHGPGKFYHPSYVMKDKELSRAVGLLDPLPAHCMHCHTDGAPSIKAFDFATMWAKIDHGPAAKAAWQKQKGDAAAKPQAKAR